MAREPKTTRRRFVELTGATGLAVGLAGCSGGDGGDGGDGNGSDGGDGGGNDTDGGDGGGGDGGDGGGGDPVDPKWTNGVWSVPKNLQYNSYNQSAPYSGKVEGMTTSPLIRTDWKDGSRMGYVAEEWGKQDGKYVITLSDKELPFHDGEGKLTAQDVATKFKLDTYLQYSLSNFTKPENIQAGDGKVTVGLTKDFNEAILNERFAGYYIDTPHHIYEKYLQMFQDASTEDETTKAQEELTTLTLDEPVGSGPFKFAEVSSKRLLLEKWEKHPAADTINFPNVDYIHTNSNQAYWQALRGDEVDGGGRFTPQKVVDSYPDYVREYMIPSNWGMGLGFNYRNKHYKKRDVRKAIAYALDREEIAKNSGGSSKVGVGRISGVPGTMQDYPKQLLGDYYDRLETYGLKSKPEKAAEHMEKAGYTKENGKWTDQDGQVPEFPMKVPAGFSDWVSGTQTTVSQVSQLGLNAEMVTVEGSSFWTQWADKNYKVIAMAWTAGNTVPYLNFDYQLRNSEVLENAGFPMEEATVPEFWKPDGDAVDAKIDDRLTTLAKTSPDADDYQQKVAELAWIENQTMIRMPIQEKLRQEWQTTDDWNLPAVDRDSVHQHQHWYLRHGDLTAKTK
jgi:peptide/nickel transport system substrate-binding protein